MSVTLTTEILVAGCGCSSDVAGKWLAPLQAAIDKFKISDSPSAVASLLANVGVESQGLTVFEEGLYYTAQRLAAVWPFRYAVDAHAATKIPNDTAIRIQKNPQATANNVYANRMGNGNEASGDGYKYRGEGPIQLTGHDQFMRFFAAIDVPLNTDPTELQSPDLGAMSAAWFYVDSKAADYGVQGNFDMTCTRVNGQGPCAANQGDLRRARYAATLPLCLAAAQPVKASSKQSKSQTTPPPQQ